ncbi:MAG: hypothetical protein ACTS42_02135 [Candidatus Hodgkinia cicadicola]
MATITANGGRQAVMPPTADGFVQSKNRMLSHEVRSRRRRPIQ